MSYQSLGMTHEEIQFMELINKVGSDSLRIAKLFSVERVRQVEKEGWTVDHDDKTGDMGQLANAAACYAEDPETGEGRVGVGTLPPRLWPWSSIWWKPAKPESGIDGRLRELEKAGALLIAEYQRLERLKAKGGEQ